MFEPLPQIATYRKIFQSCFGVIARPDLFNHWIIFVVHLNTVFDSESPVKRSSPLWTWPTSLILYVSEELSLLPRSFPQAHAAFLPGLDVLTPLGPPSSEHVPHLPYECWAHQVGTMWPGPDAVPRPQKCPVTVCGMFRKRMYSIAKGDGLE